MKERIAVLKGFYFSQVEKEGLGPRKKILGQIKTMEQFGISLKLVESPFCRETFFRRNFWIRQIICRLPFTYAYSKHEYKKEYDNAEVFYIRFLAGDRQFVKFIRELRVHNPNAKIIMELADYPTTWYMTSSKLYTVLYLPLILKDYFAAKQYKKYINRILMLKNEKFVYGIPVIKFTNGIDMDSIRERNLSDNDLTIVKIIAVAAMCEFHGYDRIIEGLYLYYKAGGTRNIELHFVGGSDEPGHLLGKYKKLCCEYHLNNRVYFYGEKRGDLLDQIYDKCNIAVASLGMYRIGYETANSLKIREYMAKGLPVITGCPIDILQGENYKYCCEFPNNSSPIDFEKVLSFFDTIYQNVGQQYVANEIRKYAYEKCDMHVSFKSVVDYLTNEKSD